MSNDRNTTRSAFTLIEAMVALSITAMAGAVLLLATEGLLDTTNDAVDRTIAQGLAAQLVDEVLGSRYCAADDPYETSMSGSSWERSGQGRERFNDTDDYNGFTAAPPEDVYGNLLAQGDANGNLRHPALRGSTTEFQKWNQKIEVYYVDPSDPTVRRPNSQPSDYRAVEVTIQRIEPGGAARPVASMRRVFCYVPIP